MPANIGIGTPPSVYVFINFQEMTSTHEDEEEELIDPYVNGEATQWQDFKGLELLIYIFWKVMVNLVEMWKDNGQCH